MSASHLSWLDYDERERRRMLDVLDGFREQDTRDELGIGSVRDAISDLLVPGITTIQRRVRYFLFIPWIYLELEAKKSRPPDIARVVRKRETDLIEELRSAGEDDGLIGEEAGSALKRLPSSIYWQGLASWGIRRFHGSQEQYHRLLERHQPRALDVVRTDDGDVVMPRQASWHGGLPARPDDPARWATFSLSKEEAEYIRERIITSHRATLLAHLVDGATVWAPVDFPWLHPGAAGFPAGVRRVLDHGRNLSVVMLGAAYLYNLLVAELANRGGFEERYRQKMSDWSDSVLEAESDLRSWDRSDFWRMVDTSPSRVGPRTRDYVTRWIDLTLGTRPPVRLADDANARRLLTDRERQLKGARSRIENPRARELWSGAAATAPLEYRWTVAQRIILDILDGLGRD